MPKKPYVITSFEHVLHFAHLICTINTFNKSSRIYSPKPLPKSKRKVQVEVKTVKSQPLFEDIIFFKFSPADFDIITAGIEMFDAVLLLQVISTSSE